MLRSVAVTVHYMRMWVCGKGDSLNHGAIRRRHRTLHAYVAKETVNTCIINSNNGNTPDRHQEVDSNYKLMLDRPSPSLAEPFDLC